VNPLNYCISFISGIAAENRVRFWVESRTRIIDAGAGITEDYYQCASCKSEDTFAKTDLFLPDNYDFLPVFGPEYALIFRRRVRPHERYRETRQAQEMWGGQRYRLRDHPDADLLETNDAIRRLTHEGILLVGQTELADAATGLRAIIEFPVKTMNIHDETNSYQVDTGPLMFPDLSRRYPRLVDSLRPAYVAFNAPDFADFVVEVPTPVELGDAGGPGAAMTHHFSDRISLPASNRVFGVSA
jgi:hypothetical protein